MEKLFYIVVALFPMAFASCDKDSEGLNYDFSNALPPPATLSYIIPDGYYPGDSLIEGDAAPFQFSIAEARQEAITVTYDVSGAIEMTGQTAEIPRNSRSVTITLETTGVVPADQDAADIIVTLTKAVSASGVEYRIGAYNDGEPETAEVTVKK